MSSIIYKTGSNLFSREFPRRKLVPRFINSSYGPSLTYPELEIDSVIGSFREPVPDTITSYCLEPLLAGQDDISSITVSIGLYPSAFFSLNAIFLIDVLDRSIYRSDFLG